MSGFLIGHFETLDGRTWDLHEIQRGNLIITPPGKHWSTHGRPMRSVHVREDYRGTWIIFGHEYLHVSRWYWDQFNRWVNPELYRPW